MKYILIFFIYFNIYLNSILSDNMLTDLPEFIGNLTNLVKL